MGSLTFNAGFAQNETNTKGWRFKDIDIPIVKDRSGFDLKADFDLDAIKNSLMNIFHWKKGERILNPEFGNPLYNYLYEPMNEETSISIGAAVQNSIALWEPRVNVLSIDVAANYDSNEYIITLKISIPSLNINSITYDYILTSA